MVEGFGFSSGMLVTGEHQGDTDPFHARPRSSALKSYLDVSAAALKFSSGEVFSKLRRRREGRVEFLATPAVPAGDLTSEADLDGVALCLVKHGSYSLRTRTVWSCGAMTRSPIAGSNAINLFDASRRTVVRSQSPF